VKEHLALRSFIHIMRYLLVCHERTIYKRESTDAEHGGGTTRSSDEVSVMEIERRGCAVRF